MSLSVRGILFASVLLLVSHFAQSKPAPAKNPQEDQNKEDDDYVQLLENGTESSVQNSTVGNEEWLFFELDSAENLIETNSTENGNRNFTLADEEEESLEIDSAANLIEMSTENSTENGNSTLPDEKAETIEIDSAENLIQISSGNSTGNANQNSTSPDEEEESFVTTIMPTDSLESTEVGSSDEDSDEIFSRNSTVIPQPEEEKLDEEDDIISPEITETFKWPNATVIYKIDANFTAAEQSVITGAMGEISEKTCVQFQAQTNESAYVQINRGGPNSTCHSEIGFLGNVQHINLDAGTSNVSSVNSSSGSCIHHGTVVHELLHTIGFFHEQSRPDRDQFVTINAENILPRKYHNFNNVSEKLIPGYKIGYDYGSIMHYGTYAFAANRSVPTIIPKTPQVKIGQIKGLSEKDVQKINGMYSDQKCFQLGLESKMREISERNRKIANSYAVTSKATLYSEPNFGGVSEDFNISPRGYNAGCYNLKNIPATVKSIQTFDSCVRVFDQRDCDGNMRAYSPYEKDQANILDITIVSIGPCFEVPHFGGSIETLKNSMDAIMHTLPMATLYSGRNKTGDIEEYNVGNFLYTPCQNLKKLAGRRQVKSVENYGTCLRLFTKPDCGGTVQAINPLTPISTKNNVQSVLAEAVKSVGPCWELPYGQNSLYKLRASLDKIISTLRNISL